MEKKFIRIAAAFVLCISIMAASVAVPVINHANDVYAKTTYKVLKGKLVNASSKKVIKGYAVYSNKLYYNGSLKKGNAAYSNKLYYNGSLKKGNAVYSNKLYYNGSLKKGYAAYSNKLYYNGGLKKGNAAYSNKLYYNGSLKKGYAAYSNKLYYNGSLKSGYVTYSSKLYRNGTLFTGTYNTVYYKSGVKYTGTAGNTQYKNGVAVGKTSNEAGSSKIQSISNKSGSILTNVTVTTGTDVYKVIFGSYEMHYGGNNTFSYALTNVKAGTAFMVYAYDENNKLLQSMKYTVK